MVATPHIHRLRYRREGRVRYGDNLLSWLGAQATRLGLTVSEVFAMLVAGASAAQVTATEPEEEEPDPENP